MKSIEYAKLSPCMKRKVGAVVYKDGEVISYGFNHGFDEKCACSMSEKNPHVLHAEQMALIGDKSVYYGAVLEVTYAPCIKCAVLIEQCKIKRVDYLEDDKSLEGVNYLKSKGIEICKLKSKS